MKQKTGTTNLSSQKEKLSGHPLVRLLIENLEFVLIALASQAEQVAETYKEWSRTASAVELRLYAPDDTPFIEKQIYQMNVYEHVSNLINAVERLEDCCTYISRFPQPRTFEKDDITEDKWIHYHHSYYLLTVVGMFDTALLLVNTLLSLRIDPRRCTKASVIRKSEVRGTPVEIALKEIDDIVGPYRTPRNLYVHRNITPKLASLEILKLHSLCKRLGQPTLDTHTLDAVFRIKRREIVVELKEEIHRITIALMQLFDSLQPLYISRAGKL